MVTIMTSYWSQVTTILASDWSKVSILTSDWSKVTILTSDWSRTAPGRLEAAEGEDEDEHQNLKKVRAFLEEAYLSLIFFAVTVEDF